MSTTGPTVASPNGASSLDLVRSKTADAPTQLDLVRTGAALEPSSGEHAHLRARADAGQPLSPVEQGTLARLDKASTPKTVADFTLSNANKQDKADLKAALDYLQQKGPDGKYLSPTAAKLLSDLPKGFRINITHDGDDSYNPATKTINWDPRSALIVDGTSNKQSPALGLIHEIDHATHGLRRPVATNDGYDNTEERRVITGSETTIAHDLGEPTRTSHGGTATLNEPSSTTHTGVDEGKAGKAAPATQTPAEQQRDLIQRIIDLLKSIF